MSIVIINYGLSNLNSVLYAIKKVYDNVLITQDAHIILKAKLLILPGIGTYKEGMKNLQQLQLFEPIRDNGIIMGLGSLHKNTLRVLSMDLSQIHDLS